jgi:hypothetical protein
MTTSPAESGTKTATSTLSQFGIRTRGFDLGILFLTTDLFFFALAIYCSGGEKSWLFPLLLVRVAYQNQWLRPRLTSLAGKFTL